jgi:hypothetical protein
MSWIITFTYYSKWNHDNGQSPNQVKIGPNQYPACDKVTVITIPESTSSELLDLVPRTPCLSTEERKHPDDDGRREPDGDSDGDTLLMCPVGDLKTDETG